MAAYCVTMPPTLALWSMYPNCYVSCVFRFVAGVPEPLCFADYFASEHLPCVMLACKSDPECPLQVKPSDGNALGEPYNIGLIEVTTRTSEGKTKMRNAVRWLLYKLEQRQREDTVTFHRRPS